MVAAAVAAATSVQVLGEETEELLPPLLAAAPLERAARHAAQRARLVTRLASSLKTLEETVEMARLTGLPLRTIANQAQMVRTENLMLKVCAWYVYGTCMAHAGHMHVHMQGT